MIILQAIIGAILYRWRGSGKDPKVFWLNYLIKSKGPKQVIIGLTAGVILYLNGHSWLIALLSGLSIFLTIMPGWGPVFDMGRNPNGWKDWESREKGKWFEILTPLFGRETAEWSFMQRWCRDATGMLIRGSMISIPLAFLIGGWSMLICILMPVCYEISWQLKTKLGIREGTDIGEWLFGACLFAFL